MVEILSLILLKYCNALEWEIRFTGALNAAKNIDYIEKCLKLKLFIIKFPTKNSLDDIYIPEVELEDPKICHFLNYYFPVSWENTYKCKIF